jgi:PST family polysaccharide transporter
MLAFLAGNLDKFVVGWTVGPDELGVYFIMFTYGTAGPSLLTGIINTVMFPTYSVLNERPEALRRAYSESLRFVAEFSSIVSMGLAAGSTLFVLVLLGDKWEAGVMSLTLLSLAGFFMSLTSPAGNVFISVGRPDLILRITLAFFLPMVPLLVLSAESYGVTGVAAIILGHESCKCIYVVYRAGTLINADVGEMVSHIVPFVIAGIVAGLVVLAITILLGTTLVALLLAILIGMTAYLVLGSVLSKGALLRDIRDGVRVMRVSRV